MTRQEELEIERLVGDIAEEGPSLESMRRLNELLLDRDDLQLYYANVMALHSMLAYELNLSLQPFAPLSPPPRQAAPRVPDDACVALSQKIASDVSWSGGARTRQPFFWVAAASLAVAILVAMIPLVGQQFLHQGEERQVIHLAPAPSVSSDPQWPASGELTRGNRNLVLSDAEDLEQFSRVTKTTPISSMMLPVCNASDFPMLTFCSGAVWMERPSGQKARSYMLSVPPAHTIQLSVDADARGQNSLAVVEIDMFGRMTGSAVNFNNTRDELGSGGFEPIGNWSQHNGTDHYKYYLFSGTHSPVALPAADEEKSPNQSWYLSDYRVFLETAEFVFIGWDDSGYVADIHEARKEGYADFDFDDISAFIRVSKDQEPAEKFGFVRHTPPPAESLGVVEKDDSMFEFSVAPGEKVVLRMSADAFLQNGLDIIEAKSGRVLWHTHNRFPDLEVGATTVTQIYLIENGTDEPEHYYLRGQSRQSTTDPDHPWTPNPYRILHSEGTMVIVGYEDSTVPRRIDWNDMQVQIRRFPLAQ